MLRLSLRTLLAHKGRFAMTTFAVVVGVGFVVGSFVVTDTLRRSVDELFETITTVDITVRAATELDSGGGGGPASRGRIDRALADEVEAVDGVAAADGSVVGYAQLVAPDGEPVTTTGAPLFGFNWPDDPRLSAAVIEDGRPPERAGEVAIDRGTADDYDFSVGDRTTMIVTDGQVDVEVVGVFRWGDTNSLLGARLTGMEPAWADEVLAAGGQVDTVDVLTDDGEDPAAVAARITAVLPDGVEAVPSEQVIDEGQDQVSGFLSIFQNVLLAFAGIAVFVSAFYINNTFAIVLGQRVRELSLLRALGASGSQVVRSVVLEAAAVGVLASVLGVGVGLLIAGVLQGILAAGGFELPERAMVLGGRTLIAAAVVGVPITILSALPAARRAAHVPPIAGLAGTGTAGTRSKRSRVVLGTSLVTAGVAILAVGLFVLDDTGATFACLGVGTIAVFLGVATLSPLIATPASGVLGWPLAHGRGPTGRLARANAMRSPERTARTAAALMIGLALVTTALVVGESMKRSFADAVSGAVTADYVISGGDSFTGFSPELATELRALPEIGAATGIRFDRFAFDGNEADLTAVDADAAAAVVDVDLVDGSFDDLDAGSIMIHEDPADERSLEVGDTVEVTYASGGPQEVEVAGIYRDATFAGNYVVDLDVFAEHYPANNLDLFVFARVADGVDAAEARPAIEAALEDYPQVTLESREEFNESQQEQVDQILLAVNGLLGLALLIALLGIANTLALSVVERTREIGLLRAVGQSRRQARLMVLAEALIVSLFGTVLGVAIGLVLGLGAVSAMPPSIINTTAVPTASIVVVVVLAAVFGLVAGLLPARRASRLDVLDAISTE
ncbi:MAG: ABC transporter permease [Acidimicrobiales bacterium]|nr:ABC transporter permease [Acidimicrobiales bacterium]